jgi:PEGA domain-containing protein
MYKYIHLIVIFICLLFEFNAFSEETHIMSIISSPPGAKVFVDGLEMGITPLVINSITQNIIKIKIKKKYYKTIEQIVSTDTIAVDREIKYKLIKESGYLNLDYFPNDAEVYLNKKKIKDLTKFPVKIDYGKYKLSIKRIGYHSIVKKIEMNQKNKLLDKILLTPKSKTTAILYSTLFPGGGQTYIGKNNSGFLFMAVAFFGSLFSYQSTRVYLDFKKEYKESFNLYMDNTNPETMVNLRKDMLNKYESLKNKDNLRTLAISITTLIWTYNLYDIYFNFPKFQENNITLNSDIQENGFSLEIKFEF